MCDLQKSESRTFCAGSASLVQCLKCSTLGFHIGTAYFTAKPMEMEGLTQWFLNIRSSEADRNYSQKTLYLQLQKSRIMLALSAGDFEDLLKVLQQGLLWSSNEEPDLNFTTVSQMVH